MTVVDVNVTTLSTTKIWYVKPKSVGFMLKKSSMALTVNAGLVRGVELPAGVGSHVGSKAGNA